MVQDKRSARLSSKSLNKSDVERKSSLKKKGTPSWKSKNQSVKWRVENDKKDNSSAARYRSSGLSSDCESSDNGRQFRKKRFTKIRRSASETSSCTSIVSEETTSVCSSSDGYNSSIIGKKRKVVRRYQVRSPAANDARKRRKAWSSGQSCTSAETSTCESFSDGKGTVYVRKTRSQNTRRKGTRDSGVSCTSDTSGGESLYAKSRKLYRQKPSSKDCKKRDLWRHVKKQRRVRCGDDEYVVTSESSCSVASSRGSYKKTSKKVWKVSNQCAFFPMPVFDKKGCPIGIQPVPMKQMQAMFCPTQNVEQQECEDEGEEEECNTTRKPKEIECTKVKTCIKEKYSTCSSSVASQTEKKSMVVRSDSKKMKTFGNPPERILQNFEDKNPEDCSMSDEDNKVVKTKEKIVYDPETQEKKLVTITKTCQTERVRSNCGNKSDAESAKGVSKGDCGEIEIKSSKVSHFTNSDKSSSCHSSRRIQIVKKSGNCSDRSTISKGDQRGSSYIGAVNNVLRKKQAYERALQKLEDGEDVEEQLRCLERKQRSKSGRKKKKKRKRRKKQMESPCDELESTASCHSEIVFTQQQYDGSNECSGSLMEVDCEQEVTETCQQVEETCQDISDICDDGCDVDDEKPLKDLMCRQLAYFKSIKQAKKFKQDYVDCLEENKDNVHRSVCVEMEIADLRCLYKKALRKVRKKKRAYQRCLAELGITMQEDEELKNAEDIENKYKRREFKSYFGQFTVSKRPDKVGASKSLLLVNNRMKEMRDKTQFLREAFNAKLQKREENKLSEATEVLEKLQNVVKSMKSGIPLLEVQNLRKFLESGGAGGGRKKRRCPPPDPCDPCPPDPCDPCAPPMTDCEKTISVFSDKLCRDATKLRSVTMKGCSSRSSAGGRQFSQTSISVVEKKRCPPSKKKKKGKKGRSSKKSGNCGGGGCGCCTTATGNWKTASCTPFCEINCREPRKPKRPANSAKEMVKMLADTIKQKDCSNYVDLFKYKVNEKNCTPKKRKPELKTHYQINERELGFEDEKRAISKKFEDPFETRKLKEMFPMFARFEDGCNGAMTPKELYDCVHDCGLGSVNFTIETAVRILENWVTDERKVSIKECLFAVHKPETYLKVVKDEMLLCNAVEEWIEKFRSRLSRNMKKEKKRAAAAGILKSRCGKLGNTAEDEFLRLKRRHWMESEKEEESSIGINSS